MIKALNGADELSEVCQEELKQFTETVCAMSVTTVPGGKSLLVLATEPNSLKSGEIKLDDRLIDKQGEIYMYEIQKCDGAQPRLQLVFKCSKTAEQMPVLPNQIRIEHSRLLQRAITDLSVDINNSAACGNQAENINN